MQGLRTFWSKGVRNKLILIAAGFGGLFSLCCIVALLSPSTPRTASQPTAVIATQVPTMAATEQPTLPPTTIPTAVPPTLEPEPTSAPIVGPTDQPPVFAGSGRDQTVSPAWYPCKEGQIKGNRNSKIYHIPTGRSYAKTFRDVACFDTTAAAKAAGYRAAQN